MTDWGWNEYWVIGKGAAKEAERWVARPDPRGVEHEPLKIIYSSPQSVKLYDEGDHLGSWIPEVLPDGLTLLVQSGPADPEIGYQLLPCYTVYAGLYGKPIGHLFALEEEIERAHELVEWLRLRRRARIRRLARNALDRVVDKGNGRWEAPPAVLSVLANALWKMLVDIGMWARDIPDDLERMEMEFVATRFTPWDVDEAGRYLVDSAWRETARERAVDAEIGAQKVSRRSIDDAT
jgi:hypothetical protein